MHSFTLLLLRSLINVAITVLFHVSLKLLSVHSHYLTLGYSLLLLGLLLLIDCLVDASLHVLSQLLLAGVYHINEVLLQMVDLSQEMLLDLLLHRMYLLDLLLSPLPLLLVPHLFLEVIVLQVHGDPFEVRQRPLLPLEKIYLEYPHPDPRIDLANQAHLMHFLRLDLLTEPNFDISALAIERISQSLDTLLIPRQLSIDIIEMQVPLEHRVLGIQIKRAYLLWLDLPRGVEILELGEEPDGEECWLLDLMDNLARLLH